ncbi:S-layer homology domain-containing protein [Paenibacillus lycopersici]|uniref:S-layer homology domain-containing protein n=1 Tax=Paenibacillus lycopersici TaxID=2704462 RepID=A0A6C0FN13_9BACL|nr:S-layer homology domain-containing protein [Paenibacillus lycopersici]QHT58526.1 S-layer homology domain-containing protein [Paenibacillus lycopersici]
MNRRSPNLAFLLACSLLAALMNAVTGYAAAPSAAHENDRPPWAGSRLEEGLSEGWLHGYADGTSRLGKSITRAEFVTFVNRAFALTASVPVASPDLHAGDWYAGEFAKAVKAGYIDADGGELRPQQAVSREEAAVMIAALLKLDLTGTDVSAFKDGDAISGADRGAVAALLRKGILDDFTDGSAGASFNPSEPLTRAGAVSMIYAARESNPSGG